MINDPNFQTSRDRSISHTFGLHFDPINALKHEVDETKVE